MNTANEFFGVLAIIIVLALVAWNVASYIYTEYRAMIRDEAAKDKRVSRSKK